MPRALLLHPALRWGETGCHLCPVLVKHCAGRDSRSALLPDRCPSSSATKLPVCASANAGPAAVLGPTSGIQPPCQTVSAQSETGSTPPAEQSAGRGEELWALRPWPLASVLSAN